MSPGGARGMVREDWAEEGRGVGGHSGHVVGRSQHWGRGWWVLAGRVTLEKQWRSYSAARHRHRPLQKSHLHDQSCATDYYHDCRSCVARPAGSTGRQHLQPVLMPGKPHARLTPACTRASRALRYHQARGRHCPVATRRRARLDRRRSSPPTSAQDKKAAAEKTRDSILADIADARLKAKVQASGGCRDRRREGAEADGEAAGRRTRTPRARPRSPRLK